MMSTPSTESPEMPMAPWQSGALAGYHPTVAMLLVMCAVPPPVSNENDDWLVCFLTP